MCKKHVLYIENIERQLSNEGSEAGMLSTTKDTIAKAFLELLEKRAFDKITVKDVVETCQITRQTFYYHFQDIMELAEWALQHITRQSKEQWAKGESLEEEIKGILLLAVETRELIHNLLSSVRRESTERIIIQAVRSSIRNSLDRKELCVDLSVGDLEMALNFHAYAMMGVILEYCVKPDIDIDRIAGQICRLMKGEMVRFD